MPVLCLTGWLSCAQAPRSAADIAPPAPDAPVAFEDAPPPAPTRPTERAPETPGETLRLGVTLDRPLYRPGETVWARVFAVVDGASAPGDITAVLVGPQGQSVWSGRFANGGRGAPVTIDLRPEAPGGEYKLRVTVGAVQTERPFIVAGFEEPRIRKELDLLRDAYGPGDEVIATVKLASAGHGPLANHALKATVLVDGDALAPIETVTDGTGEATLRFRLPDTIVQPDVLLSVAVQEEGWTESISKAVPVVLDRVAVEWFPEGGDLVVGLPSRVYLRARDAHGEPADAAGEIRNDRGELVASFRTVHDGLGRFALTPEAGRTYTARITEPVGIDTPIALPVARATGCVLRAYDDLDGRWPALRVGVWCTDTREVAVGGALGSRGFAPQVVMAGPREPAVVHLTTGTPKGDGWQGIARVTVSTLDGPVAERLVYRNRLQSLHISLTPTAERHGPRDEVQLEVTARDPDGAPVEADLALAVVDDRVLKLADDEHGDLRTALHLAPFAAKLDDPAWYFDPDEADAPRGLDLVMGTYGWRRIERVVATVTPEPGDGLRRKAPTADAARELRPADINRSLAERAGVLGAMNDADLGPNVVGIGAVGEGGFGGLGARGMGLGGGGVAEGLGGLGGLGTKDLGSGAAGYGRGGGLFGAKGEGGSVGPGGDPIILGALERPLIDEVVKRNLNQIRYCYQREMTKKPDLRGQITIKFVVGADGTVSKASTKSTTMNNAAVEDCIVGRFLRMQFPQPRGGGIAVVSYPFVFAAEGAPLWPTQLVHSYTVVRTFAAPRYMPGEVPAVRTDFRPTVAWFPDVHTDASGKATVSFFLNDSVTTFRATAEGVAGGAIGRVELEIDSALPFSLDVPLPVEVSFGDELMLPVRVANRTARGVEVQIAADVEAPLVARDPSRRLALAAGQGDLLYVPVAVPQVAGDATITVSASAAALSERVSRTLHIAPRGFPARFSAGGVLERRQTHTFTVDDPLPGGTSVGLRVYTNPLAELGDGLESMIRIPHGCFEQTSSSNHPNVMILSYLERAGRGAGLAATYREALTTGYSRLTSYQVERGGFETFGNGPGKEALSAYGLLQFTQMGEVWPEVSPQMVDRDVHFLLQARDGTGGYTVSGASSHQYGLAPQAVNDAYITYALAETGHLDRSSVEVRRTRALAATTSDPYLLALATLTLAKVDGSAAEPAAKLAAQQAKDGTFPGAGTSVSVSGGRDLLFETTALAALALERAGQAGPARAAVVALANGRLGASGWGGTQATVLALQALTEVGRRAPAKPGSVRVVVDGKVAGTVSYTGQESAPVIVDLTSAVGAGTHTIELIPSATGGDLPYALEVEWTRDVPADDATAPLSVSTALDRGEIALGESARLRVVVENTSEGEVPSPLARIGIPAGVRVAAWQLEGLRTRNEVAFVETRPREVSLYFDGFGPGERREIDLDLVAEIPGTFQAPPSQVHPYYTTDARRWAAGPRLKIRP